VVSADDFFYVYQNNPDLIPYFTSDSKIFHKSMEEILEFLSIETRDRIGFWRVSPVGMATHIDTHFEDREDLPYGPRGLLPGKWFWPRRLTRKLTQLVMHAGELAQTFPSAETVEFRCEWSGLRERQIADPEAMGNGPEGIARVDHCVTVGEWPITALRRSRLQIVSDLGGPVIRLFDHGSDYSPEFIQAHLARA